MRIADLAGLLASLRLRLPRTSLDEILDTLIEESGYEVACAMRAQPWGKSMLLIALTGWGQREDVDRARAAGFDHHFTKPIDALQIERLLVAFGARNELVVPATDSVS